MSEQANTQHEEKKPATLDEYFKEHQAYWSNEVTAMSGMLKNISDLPDLLNVIYAKRQDATDYYFRLLSPLAARTKEYKVQYAMQYNALKTNSQIRYSTESSINAQVEASLAEAKYTIELMENHVKFMRETIKNMDDLVYGINNRIRLQELIEGVKR